MKETVKEEKVFPAPFLVHWVTGPVACCEKHANALAGLGGFMGSHTPISPNFDLLAQCENCINENK